MQARDPAASNWADSEIRRLPQRVHKNRIVQRHPIFSAYEPFGPLSVPSSPAELAGAQFFPLKQIPQFAFLFACPFVVYPPSALVAAVTAILRMGR